MKIHGKDEDELSRSPEFGASKVNIYREISDNINDLQNDIKTLDTVIKKEKYGKYQFNSTVQVLENQREKIKDEIEAAYAHGHLSLFQKSILRGRATNLLKNILSLNE
jgi:serine phosphatase RsbU (regulator of sigma subunit)